MNGELAIEELGKLRKAAKELLRLYDTNSIGHPSADQSEVDLAFEELRKLI